MIDRKGILKEIYYSEKKMGKEMLENAVESIHATRKIRTEISYGSPPEKIVEFVKKNKTDLIVVGNVGLSGHSKLRDLGSVSRCISECSPCPVLIVHWDKSLTLMVLFSRIDFGRLINGSVHSSYTTELVL